MNELTGTTIVNYGSLGTAANGTYSGVTLDQIDAPGGGRAGLWDGVNDQGNPWSAALAAAHTPTEQTVPIWWRVYDAAVWTDATYRQIIQVAYDTNTNRAYAGRVSITDNGIYGVIRTNGVYKSTTTTSYANLSWHLSTLTVSYSADQFKHYEDATQIGATQTGLGNVGKRDYRRIYQDWITGWVYLVERLPRPRRNLQQRPDPAGDCFHCNGRRCVMATLWRGYFFVESLDLTADQRATLVAALKAWGLRNTSVYPNERNHWAVRPDGLAVIFEAVFDADNLTAIWFRTKLSQIFSVSLTSVTATVATTTLRAFSNFQVQHGKQAAYGYIRLAYRYLGRKPRCGTEILGGLRFFVERS